MKGSGEATRRICTVAAGAFGKREIGAEIVDLREVSLAPCMGCGSCREKSRCGEDDIFNQIYDKMVEADYLFFISPYRAPVPARLCMLLEKMSQLTIVRRQKEPSYEPELHGKLAGIISHGGGGERMLMHYKAMVNDTIADALQAAWLKVVPFNSMWNTGISFPVTEGLKGKETVPVWEWGWERMEEKVGMYVEIVVRTSRIPYAVI